MKTPSLTELAKGEATFERYQEGVLWYKVSYNWHADVLGDSDGYLDYISIPVPIDDAGGGSFEPKMKGLSLMRWIRKHLELINDAKRQQEIEFEPPSGAV